MPGLRLVRGVVQRLEVVPDSLEPILKWLHLSNCYRFEYLWDVQSGSDGPDHVPTLAKSERALDIAVAWTRFLTNSPNHSVTI